MILNDIKPLVRGVAKLQYIMAGGIAVYHIIGVDGNKYQLEIDLSDKKDIGENAAFKPTEKGLLLMRWIRRANENDTLIKVK